MDKTHFFVRDFMTDAPHAVEPHEPVEVALRRMRGLNVLHMPVRAAGRPVGILAERDLGVLVGINGKQPSLDLKKIQVMDVMTPDPYCVTVDTELAEVATTMAKLKIGSALVVDDDGQLVGIFTVNDALDALAALS